MYALSSIVCALWSAFPCGQRRWQQILTYNKHHLLTLTKSALVQRTVSLFQSVSHGALRLMALAAFISGKVNNEALGNRGTKASCLRCTLFTSAGDLLRQEEH